MRIEDLAVVGDTQTLAIIGRDGAVSWMCLPRFDSAAVFASLLGTREHGRFLIAPRGGVIRTERRYRKDSLVLETDFHTKSGVVRVTDVMPIRGEAPDLVRIVEGLEGSVEMEVDIVLRFGYGHIAPWKRRLDGRLSAIAGPDAVVLATPTEATTLRIEKGDRVPFVMTYHASHVPPPRSPDAAEAVEHTDAYWRKWAARGRDRGPYRDDIVRSLITLEALRYRPTGGIVAAGTTSLPESLGGERNWDYRFCWLRDAAFSLYALLHGGYHEEALAWREWLLRAVAGDPKDLQTVYGVAGERWIGERELDWLPGYEGARPVRVGNGAADQLQLDIYGELLDTFHQARRFGLKPSDEAWPVQRAIAEWLESNWTQPDEGLWEIRADRAHHTHSKVMAWVAMDRVIKAVEKHGLDGPVDRWKRVRAEIHRDVCDNGYDRDRGTFTQAYGSNVLDASLLLIPSVGFLPPDDPRVKGTIEAIEQSLMPDGFVLRYPTKPGKNLDGLPGQEGAFLACSFWLVDALVLTGRRKDAEVLFERLRAIRNDLGLMSEEYDPRYGRLVGNFPQVFSHVAFINSARGLTSGDGARHRAET